MFFFRRQVARLGWLLLPLGVAGLLTVTVLGQLGAASFFLFELASQFAVQYTLLGTLLLVWALVQRRWAWGLLSGLCVIWQAVLVVPWLMAKPPPVVAGRPGFRVMHANVLFTRSDLSRTFALVGEQRADLIVLQEMTVAQIPNAIAYFRATYPHRDTIRSKGPSHILVLSRTPFQISKWAKTQFPVIYIRTTIRGRAVELITVHPRPPILPGWYAERNRQLAFVSGLLRRTQQPALLVGDCNISPFSPLYRTWFGQAGIQASRYGFGLQPTWPRFLPLAYLPIDHVFINDRLTTTDFTVLNQPGSDHQAVRVDLQFRP